MIWQLKGEQKLYAMFSHSDTIRKHGSQANFRCPALDLWLMGDHLSG